MGYTRSEVVKYGKWIWANDGYFRCSNCTQKAPVAKRYQDEFETTETPYCPWCGFKMVGIGVE